MKWCVSSIIASSGLCLFMRHESVNLENNPTSKLVKNHIFTLSKEEHEEKHLSTVFNSICVKITFLEWHSSLYHKHHQNIWGLWLREISEEGKKTTHAHINSHIKDSRYITNI